MIASFRNRDSIAPELRLNSAANSAIHKRYLEKFDKQETQIEKLQEEIKKQLELQRKQRKEYEDFLAGLNVE